MPVNRSVFSPVSVTTQAGGEITFPFSVPINYYFLYDKGGVDTQIIPLPNEPESISISQAQNHETFYSVTGDRIIRRTSERKFSITISGRSGLTSRLYYSKEKFLLDNSFLTEVEDILKNFEQYLNDVTAHLDAGGIGKTSVDITKETAYNFEFYDLANGRIFSDVVVDNFTYNRSINGSRMGYEWQLSITAYNAKPFDHLGLFGAFFKAINDVLNGASTAMLQATSAIDSVNTAILLPFGATMDNLRRVGTSFEKAVSAGIGVAYGIKSAVIDAEKAINDVIKSVEDSIKAVRDLFGSDDTNDKKRDTAEDWNDARSAFDYLDETNQDQQVNSDLEAIRQALENAKYQASILKGYINAFAVSHLPPIIEGGSFLDKDGAYEILSDREYYARKDTLQDRDNQTYERYIIRAGENLQTIAHKLYGDASLWFNIARANNWQDAHINHKGYPSKAGDIIRIPNLTNQPLLTLSPQLKNDDSPFLTDLYLKDGDIDFIANDIKIVNGKENLIQAINNRLKTASGELHMTPEYGIKQFLLGDSANEKAYTFLAVHIANQFRQDERIINVNEIEVTGAGDTANVSLKITPIEQNSVELILPVTR